MIYTLFDVREIPQIPNIGLGMTSHVTSERGADSAEAHGRAIVDTKGHLVVFMTFDTDFGDAFEQEAESPDYFQRFSVPAYEIAADVLVYALTHEPIQVTSARKPCEASPAWRPAATAFSVKTRPHERLAP